MVAIPGGSDEAPDNPLERARARLRSRAPFLSQRVQRLMVLAAVAASGPDPESALPQLEAAERSLAAFLKLTPHP